MRLRSIRIKDSWWRITSEADRSSFDAWVNSEFALDFTVIYHQRYE